MSIHVSRRRFVEAAAATLAAPLLPNLSSAENSSAAERTAVSGSLADDLLEITIPRLHALYDARKYTPSQVTHWYLDRIARYDHVYRAMLHVDTAGALARAAACDAELKRGGNSASRPPLWGVPIVIKTNTSVKGLVTSAGWWGYNIPGQELVAPVDAPVVRKLRAAGAIILGQTNMPDFAASDTNFSTVFGRTGNAYNYRCSPGGSSGGTVTAVTANYCVLGTGTDTANSIRMPASTSSVVGVLPTRGLVSIAGINPLDWLRDNTGPIARDVTDAAIALGVMAGSDPGDFRTKDADTQAQPGPYTKYLSANALKGKRFGVPAFIVAETPPGTGARGDVSLRPETRALFMKALDGLRAAGATVVTDDALLDQSFTALVQHVDSRPYRNEGVENFLRDFGPSLYHSPAEYAQATGNFIPGFGGNGPNAAPAGGDVRIETDPQADEHFWGPQRRAVEAYDATLAKFNLDGLVYPAAQMPPNDELAEAAAGIRSSGPHSNTGWVNPIGVPAVVVPGGFYADGLPFGLELSARRWKDGDLLGWAFAYEQATKYRHPPTLVEKR